MLLLQLLYRTRWDLVSFSTVPHGDTLSLQILKGHFGMVAPDVEIEDGLK